MQYRFTFSDLVCAFNEPWEGGHPLCEQHAMQLRREFREAVARGDMDAQGYTPNERKAQARRQATAC